MAGTNRHDDECTPEARVTKSLLGYGLIVGPFYVIASVIDGATRSGFSFTRDSWSLLSLGDRGWIHVVVFLLTGLMVIATSVGFRRHLEAGLGHRAWLFLGAYGVLLVLAGVFLPDPTGGATTVHGLLHLAAGGLGFVGFAVTTFIVARRFFRQRALGWGWLSVVSGVLLFVGFGAIASGKSTAVTVLLFTATVVLSWVWLLLVSRRFYVEADAKGHADAAAMGAKAVA